MTDMTLEDLVDDAGDAAEEASSSGQSTGEWVSETVELLDKRGLLEPMLFGPEGAEQVREQNDPTQGIDDAEGGDDTLDLTADDIAQAGEAVMEQLGEDVTVAELVEICRDNPSLVNQQIERNL